MTSAAFGHQIENLYEGLTVFNEGAGRFVPMKSTEISIDITAGLATIKTQRVFRNNEDVSIEAILTMPVGFDAVVTGLTATIDGRKLTAIAKTQNTVLYGPADMVTPLITLGILPANLGHRFNKTVARDHCCRSQIMPLCQSRARERSGSLCCHGCRNRD